MSSTVEIGSELAGYRIESELASGGFSTVYLAEHRVSGAGSPSRS